MIMSLEVAYRRRSTSALVPYNGMRRRDEGWASGSGSGSESESERGRGRRGVSHGTEAFRDSFQGSSSATSGYGYR